MNALAEQKRSDVRGSISFQVSYRVLNHEQYQTVRNQIEPVVIYDSEPVMNDSLNTENEIKEIAADPRIAAFLSRIDEKLDMILAMLTEKEETSDGMHQGRGLDVSGSGMKLQVAHSVKPGAVVLVDFILSRFPYTRLKLFAEVIRAERQDIGNAAFFNLGVRFLDPNEKAIEKIISRVFQFQRANLRNLKKDVS